MTERHVSSRRRFDENKIKLNEQISAQFHQASKLRERSSWTLIKSFFGLLRFHRRSGVCSLVTLTFATCLALVPPASTKFIIDNVIGDQPLPSWFPKFVPTDPWKLLLLITLTVLGVSFLKTLLHISSRWHATRITKLIQMSMRKRVFAHAIRLPLHRVQEIKSGGAASILRQDAGSVGDLVFGMIYNPWRALIQLLGSLTILAWVDWRLLLGAIGIVPIVYVTHRTWISRIRPQHRRVRAQREEVDALATESFGGMRVVRAFSRQRSETRRIMRGNHVMGRLELLAWWWTRGIEIVWETIIPVASAGLMIYGGWQVIESELTLGDLMMFLVYLLMLLEPLAVLASSAATFQNSLSGLDRVLDLLDEPLEMASDSPLRKIDKSLVQGGLSFDEVGFHYHGSEIEALKSISIDIQPGETLALVGPSGAGKTTFCNLVARFYDPTQGAIYLASRMSSCLMGLVLTILVMVISLHLYIRYRLRRLSPMRTSSFRSCHKGTIRLLANGASN